MNLVTGGFVALPALLVVGASFQVNAAAESLIGQVSHKGRSDHYRYYDERRTCRAVLGKG